jgi:hypothetical protein
VGGIIDLLALLDGWDYREVSNTVQVFPGEITEVFSENVKGWLELFGFTATDAFTHVIVKMPPENFNILDINLAELAAYGFTIPVAPALILGMYDFPALPLSSAGFGSTFFNLPYPLPLKKHNTLHVQFTLDPGTTQASATVFYQATLLQIYRPVEFVKSYNEILNGKLLNP